jgi:hypothetical protein
MVLAVWLATAPPIDRLVIDLPITLTASSPASGVETVTVPWAGLRVGKLWDVSAATWSGLAVGVDGALWAGGFENEGTSSVNATRAYAAAEARGLAGWQVLHSERAALGPYAFVGARLGAGLGQIAVFDSVRHLFLPLWAARAGLGLETTIRLVVLRSELAAGARDGRFELTGALSLGLAL